MSKPLYRLFSNSTLNTFTFPIETIKSVRSPITRVSTLSFNAICHTLICAYFFLPCGEPSSNFFFCTFLLFFLFLKNTIHVNFLKELYVVGLVHNKYLIQNFILAFHLLKYKFDKIKIVADMAG